MSSVDNDINGNDSYLDCHDYDGRHNEPLNFWLDIVLKCCVAILGLGGNIVSVVILSRGVMRSNTFNRLLIALACVDSRREVVSFAKPSTDFG
jgi:hypothetical protein